MVVAPHSAGAVGVVGGAGDPSLPKPKRSLRHAAKVRTGCRRCK